MCWQLTRKRFAYSCDTTLKEQFGEKRFTRGFTGLKEEPYKRFALEKDKVKIIFIDFEKLSKEPAFSGIQFETIKPLDPDDDNFSLIMEKYKIKLPAKYSYPLTLVDDTAWLHNIPSENVWKNILQMLNVLFKMKFECKKEASRLFGIVHWCIANQMPYQRGSAAIIDQVFDSLWIKNFGAAPEKNFGVSLDCEALDAENYEIYAAQYPHFPDREEKKEEKNESKEEKRVTVEDSKTFTSKTNIAFPYPPSFFGNTSSTSESSSSPSSSSDSSIEKKL